MISEKMKPLMANNSAIRAMFEEGAQLKAIYGEENVYDFSLGNPNVAAPPAVTAVGTALRDVFGPVQVGAAGAAVTAGAEDAYVVYEVTFCHNLFS